MMGECENSSGPIVSRTGLEEAEDGRFGESGSVRRSAFCWRATATRGFVKLRGADVEVLGVRWDVVIPEETDTAPTVVESGDATGMHWFV